MDRYQVPTIKKIRALIARACIHTISYLGLVKLWRFWHRKKIIIFMLHNVIEIGTRTEWTPLRSYTNSTILDKALKVLSNYYTFISIDQAADMLSGRMPLRSYCMVLTFDDGYRNNIDTALPILRKYKAPCHIYIATGFAEKRCAFWYDRLDYLIQKMPKGVHAVRIAESELMIDSRSRAAMIESYDKLRQAAKSYYRSDLAMLADLEKLIDELEVCSGHSLYDIFDNDHISAVLNVEEISNYCKSNDCIFGSHTVDHIRLALVDYNISEKQLSLSKKFLEQHTGRQCLHLAYPNGSFNENVLKMAKDIGYVTAVTTIPGMNKLGDDLLQLKRYSFPNCSASNAKEILFAYSGLKNFLNQLISRIKGISTD